MTSRFRVGCPGLCISPGSGPTLAADPKDVVAGRLLSADPRYNSQLRTTCVATMHPGHHHPVANFRRAF